MNKLDNIMIDGEDKLDLETGYFTRKGFLVDSKSAKKYEKTVTELIKQAKKVKNGRVWYLTTMTLPAGVLFPDGTPDNYKWVVAPVAVMEEDETKKYPIAGSSNNYYTTRVVVEDAKKFEKFKEALVYLGMQ